ncbi:MAG: glycerol-3-phosphate dehydrogenase/oxidase [Candidatus Hodarchaeales archaeon]|jgi:glycerol-3-phosphate dehydrogenase
MTSLKYRERTIQKMSKTNYDILIIGGGITGAGIARDAALRGLSVALVEKDDFGYGTSSGSSKLVHAGIRYIGQKEFRLVREASIERKKILEMAPHITRPLKFLVPLHSDTILTKNKLRLAVWLYDLMANFRNYTFHKILGREKARSLLPNPIREINFQGAAIYGDGQMDDARLTLEVILSAEKAGAAVLNYCSAEDFNLQSPEGQDTVTMRDLNTKHVFTIQTNTLVLACGHWSDKIIQQIDPSFPSRVRPTKGVHLITKKFYNLDYAVVIPVEDGRIIFIVPFGENLLVGTTDTDYSDNFDYVPVTTEDVIYLIDAVNYLFPGALTEQDIISAYSGLRPLILSDTAKSESDVSRQHEIRMVRPNTYAITGGKYTTYRAMAKEMVDKIAKLLGTKIKSSTDKVPLNGWISTKRRDWDAWSRIACENMMIRYKLSDQVAQHLLRYGDNYLKLLDEAKEDPQLMKLVSNNRSYIFGEINYFIKHEKAITLRDVLFRRTQIQLSFEQGLDCIEAIAEHMGKIMGWSQEEIENEISKYKKALVWNP